MEKIQKKLSRILLGGGLTKHISSMVPVANSDLVNAMSEGTGVIFRAPFTLNSSNVLVLGFDDTNLDPRVNDTSGVYNPYGFTITQTVSNGSYNLAFRNSDTSITYNRGTIIPKIDMLWKSPFIHAKKINQVWCVTVDNTGPTRGFNIGFNHGAINDASDNLSESDIIHLEIVKLD